MELKDKLQLLRKQKGYSQEQLADRPGYHCMVDGSRNGNAGEDTDVFILPCLRRDQCRPAFRRAESLK